MAYELSFAGVPLRLPDPEILEHLERFDWLCDLRDVLPVQQVFPGPKLQQLGTPTPLPNPSVRIGDWFYPVGASRWSVFRSLVSADDVAAIQEVVWPEDSDTHTAGAFVMQCEGGDAEGKIKTNLHLLPPVPVAGLDGPQVYLITLVDERYWWHQWAGAGVITCTDSTGTWSQLLSHLATKLGITLTYTTPDAAYGYPEPDSALYSSEQSPAVLLDAVAANVGCVVVRNLDGTYKLQRWADALTARDANRPESGNNLLGGEAVPNGDTPAEAYRVHLPEKVVVTFPKWIDDEGYYEPTNYRGHAKDSYGAVWSEEVSIDDLGTPYDECKRQAGTKYLHTTAKARFTSSGDSTPNNATAVTTLAQNLATDYYDSRWAWLDEFHAGIIPWDPEGLSDLLFAWRSGKAFTRALPSPFNAGLSEFQHGLADVAIPPSDRCCSGFVKVTSTTPSGSYYPAKEATIDPETLDVTLGADCWYYEPNGVAPTLDSIHWCDYDGTDGGSPEKKVYVDTVQSGSGSITVEEEDGTPGRATADLIFPNDSLTADADVTKMHVNEASSTKAGLVTVGNQTFTGPKTFLQGIYFDFGVGSQTAVDGYNTILDLYVPRETTVPIAEFGYYKSGSDFYNRACFNTLHSDSTPSDVWFPVYIESSTPLNSGSYGAYPFAGILTNAAISMIGNSNLNLGSYLNQSRSEFHMTPYLGDGSQISAYWHLWNMYDTKDGNFGNAWFKIYNTHDDTNNIWYFELFGADSNTGTGEVKLRVSDSAGVHTGITASGLTSVDTVGGVVVGGSSSGPTLTVGATPISSGTSFGVLYQDSGGKLAQAVPSTTGQVLMSGSVGWETISQDVSLAAGGAATVTGLQGLEISTSTPADGDVLTWNDTSKLWEPAAPSGGTTVTMGGDVTGGSDTCTVAKINGATLGTTTATDANLLVADGSKWNSVALSGEASIDNTGAVTNSKLTGWTLADIQAYAAAY